MFSIKCASSSAIEKLQRDNRPFKNLIGIPIYFLSISRLGDVYSMTLFKDGTFKSNIEALKKCDRWDYDNENNIKEEYLECSDKRVLFNFRIENEIYGKPNFEREFMGAVKKGINLKTLFHIDLQHYQTSKLSWVSLINDPIFSTGSHAYILLGDDALKEFKDFTLNNKSQIENDEKKLAKGITPEKIFDLRIKENEEDFFFLHMNKLDDSELYFLSTPENNNLRLSEFEKKYKDLQPLKSKKYLIFRKNKNAISYDTKKRGFTIYYEDNYTGGFQRIFTNEIFVNMDIAKFEQIQRYPTLEFIAEYNIISKNETAYVSTRLSGILNKDQYEEFKIKFPEESIYIKEKSIKLRQVKLKILNFRIYDPISNESFWKP